MEGLEPVEERDREARIAVEEVPSIDAMGNCLLVHTAQTVSALTSTARLGFLLLVC